MIKPFEDLWRLAKNFENNNSVWVKSSIFKLDPETMEKEVKSMTSTAMKLGYVFNKEKPEKGAKKVVPLTGPAKMIEWLNAQLKEYQKNIPVVRVFSNPGMKDRHWTEVSKLIDFPISPEQALKLSNIISKEEVFANLAKLE